ncbi:MULTISPECIES: type VI secretion system protein TssA [unclassified Massilia]|uniref:type VI secretion system protein TssA n=1 Tax=unclassified Massilia TaxID=2609279 RepID=UPI00177B36A5|nr:MULTISPECIES: type VI secretion system protein TssA [unclassified Massilia]MBD8531179.1 type VI secretion system protein TssA [Massilia sp. CFBP 13647]MBD8675015.1 type VI secretion system protein TssA [Massilia sp. CFBP 13721]
MFKVEQCLTPVSAAAPCGEDLAFSPELDAIAQARKADDPSIEQGAWVTTLKEADWKFVTKRCAQLLETRSKDLQLAVWLAEASVKTGGLRSLGNALLVLAGLCERYWDDVYPLADEDGFERRIGNLGWIAARVPQLVAECPLTEGAAFSMRDIEAARAHGAEAIANVEAARSRTSKAFQAALLDDANHCLAALGELEKAVDDRLGADGPGFTAARTALQNLAHFVTPAAGAAAPLATASQVALPIAHADGALMPVTTGLPVLAGAIASRAQALGQLRAVADFFRRTEPHSPVAYLADKAANWGEQPLHLWLKTVVKDAGALAHVEELLGIVKEEG